MMKTTLIYVYDPMCSWCWGFSDVYQQLVEQLPEEVDVLRLLGGLAPDSDVPMPESMQAMLQQTWQRIETMIPGKQFNFDFWSQCVPRRSTYPACRAVIAAREQGDQYDVIMTQAIQQAYYQQARNPSDDATLIELAGEIGLDQQRFASQLLDTKIHQQLLDEINTARSIGIDSFPSLMMEHGGQYYPVLSNYTNVDQILNQINANMRAFG
jgi:putative protein-disulfide isomerase